MTLVVFTYMTRQKAFFKVEREQFKLYIPSQYQSNNWNWAPSTHVNTLFTIDHFRPVWIHFHDVTFVVYLIYCNLLTLYTVSGRIVKSAKPFSNSQRSFRRIDDIPTRCRRVTLWEEYIWNSMADLSSISLGTKSVIVNFSRKTGTWK